MTGITLLTANMAEKKLVENNGVDSDEEVLITIENKPTRCNSYCRTFCLVTGVLLLTLAFGSTLRFIYARLTGESFVCFRVNASAVSLRDGAAATHAYNGTKRRLPKCIVIGVRKCGTRALIEFLNLHPQISAAQEEIHFFDNDDNYQNGLEWYRNRMPYSTPGQVTLEKSPAYFITDDVPQRIHAMNASIKLVMIVRNPTTRTISDYTQVHYNKIARNKSHQNFEELAVDEDTGMVNLRLKAVRTSIYERHLARWLEVFDKSQILTLDGDNLIVDPIAEVKKVEEFLGLDHRITAEQFHFNATKGFYCMRQNGVDRCLGTGKGRKHPAVRSDVIAKLNQFFRPHNEKLFQMTGVRMNWPPE